MRTLEDYILEELEYYKKETNSLGYQLKALKEKENEDEENKKLETYKLGETLGKYYMVDVMQNYNISTILKNNNMTVEDLIKLKESGSIGNLITEGYVYYYNYTSFASVSEHIYKAKFILGKYTYLIAWDKSDSVSFITPHNSNTYFLDKDEAYKVALERLIVSVDRFLEKNKDKEEN